jgi:hypothetical protein
VADRLACEAWNKRMLAFQGPAEPSPTLALARRPTEAEVMRARTLLHLPRLHRVMADRLDAVAVGIPEECGII